MNTLYQDLKAAGIETSAWQSDLYFPATAETEAILAKHPLQKKNATKFVSEIPGEGVWIDVPFAL